MISDAQSLHCAYGTHPALGEEKKGHTSTHRAKPSGAPCRPKGGTRTKTRRPLEYGLADSYAERFGVHAAAECTIKAYRYGEWIVRAGQPRYARGGWTHLTRGVQTWEIASAFMGSDRIALRSMARVSHLVIDLDVHGEPPAFSREKGGAPDESIDEFLSGTTARQMQRETSLRARAWRASLASPLIERFLALGVVDAVCTSPRGFHLVVMLHAPVSVAEASRLACAIASRAGGTPEGVTVESFPRLRSDGRGDHCALPLLGPSRWVREDLVTPRSRKRADEVRSLIALAGRSASEIDSALASERAQACPADVPTVSALGVHHEAADYGALYGSDFVLEALRILRSGMRSGESYNALRRVVAAALYCGLSADETERALGVWLDLPTHGARHCQTRAGRTQLRALVRSQVRHFERGRTAGRCWRDGLRSRELRGEFAALLAPSDAPNRERVDDGLVRSPARDEVEHVHAALPSLPSDDVFAGYEKPPQVRHLERGALLERGRRVASSAHGGSLHLFIAQGAGVGEDEPAHVPAAATGTLPRSRSPGGLAGTRRRNGQVRGLASGGEPAKCERSTPVAFSREKGAARRDQGTPHLFSRKGREAARRVSE